MAISTPGVGGGGVGGTPDFELQGLSSLQGMFMAWKFRHGICSILNFGLGIVWDFDFCTHFNHHCHLKSGVPIIIITLTSKQAFW